MSSPAPGGLGAPSSPPPRAGQHTATRPKTSGVTASCSGRGPPARCLGQPLTNDGSRRPSGALEVRQGAGGGAGDGAHCHTQAGAGRPRGAGPAAAPGPGGLATGAAPRAPVPQAEGLTSLSILSKSSLHRVYSGMVSDMLGCRFLLEGPGCSPSGLSGNSSPNSCCWCGSTALK